jgi:hypothetical protein
VRLLGVEAEPPTVTHDGVQHGTGDGGADGVRHGHHDGDDNGINDGPRDGVQNGNADGYAEPFSLALVGDTIIDISPGELVPVDANDHAQAFLEWLQNEMSLGGRWVRRSTLVKLYESPFLEALGWSPEPWPTVVRHFAKLNGVTWRQRDGRKGIAQKGASPRDYRIPTAVVVELAAAERKRSAGA